MRITIKELRQIIRETWDEDNAWLPPTRQHDSSPIPGWNAPEEKQIVKPKMQSARKGITGKICDVLNAHIDIINQTNNDLGTGGLDAFQKINASDFTVLGYHNPESNDQVYDVEIDYIPAIFIINLDEDTVDVDLCDENG